MADTLLPEALSHTRGATEPPLIEQTLGTFFDAMADRVPEREARSHSLCALVVHYVIRSFMPRK